MSTYGVLHIPSGNFLDWDDDPEAAEAIREIWLAADERNKPEDFEIMEFDDEGFPV